MALGECRVQNKMAMRNPGLILPEKLSNSKTSPGDSSVDRRYTLFYKGEEINAGIPSPSLAQGRKSLPTLSQVGQTDTPRQSFGDRSAAVQSGAN